MSRNKKTVLALAILLGLGAVAWALLPPGPDPQLVKVQQLQQKLFDPDGKMPDADRRKAFGEFGREAEKLTPEQLAKLMRDSPFAKRMQQTVVSYFDLPEDQRVAALDKQIDEMEKFRKDMEKRRGERGGRPEGGPPGGFRNRGNMNESDMRKRMLDNTSPQERAMFGEYMQQMQARRKQRGLPTMGGPGGF
jgi:hypothetical protein